MCEKVEEHLKSIVTEKNWEDIHCLSPEVLRKVKNLHAKPTVIQYLSIGEVIEFIQPVLTVKCRNGGGKTLTFGIPAVEFAFRAKNKSTSKSLQIGSKATDRKGANQSSNIYCPTSIIVVSTQPLAEQISSVITKLQPEGISNEVLYQEQMVKSTGQILISTPRLLWKYLVKEKTIQLDNLAHFAVDEADNMIGSFQIELSEILNLLRGLDVVVQLVSATLSPKNVDFIRKAQNSDSSILEEQIIYSIELPWKLKGVSQFYEDVTQKKGDEAFEYKFEVCKTLIDRVIQYNMQEPKKASQVIIFFERLSYIASFEEQIRNHKLCWKVTTCANKKERNNNIFCFREGNYDIMLASKVMSRGIDIRKVGLVINFDMPSIFNTKQFDSDTYLHNIGRTGRYADLGVSLTFIEKCPSAQDILNTIKKDLDSDVSPFELEKMLEELRNVMENNNKTDLILA